MGTNLNVFFWSFFYWLRIFKIIVIECCIRWLSIQGTLCWNGVLSRLSVIHEFRVMVLTLVNITLRLILNRVTRFLSLQLFLLLFLLLLKHFLCLSFFFFLFFSQSFLLSQLLLLLLLPSKILLSSQFSLSCLLLSQFLLLLLLSSQGSLTILFLLLSLFFFSCCLLLLLLILLLQLGCTWGLISRGSLDLLTRELLSVMSRRGCSIFESISHISRGASIATCKSRHLSGTTLDGGATS